MAETAWADIVPPMLAAARGPRRTLRVLVIVLAVVAAAAVAALVLRSVSSGPPVALSEAFGDDGLRSCVARTLGVGVDEMVAKRDLESIDRLDCALHPLNGDGPDRSPIRSLDGAERLVGLEEIHLTWQHQVTDLRPLAALPRLTSLDLAWVPITDLAGVEGMTALTMLTLNQDGCFSGPGGTQLSDISPLAGAERLEYVFLACTDVSDLTPLANLSALRSLGLDGTSVRELEPLAGLPALTTLTLAYTPVEDVSPLADLTTLTWLNLSGTDVADVSPLDGVTDLEITR